MIRECITYASARCENAQMHYHRKGDTRERIRELKAQRGFRSDRALAAAAGLEQPTLARYLNGTTREMSAEHFEAQAQALGVTLSELLGEVAVSTRATVREAQSLLDQLTDAQLRQLISVARAMFPDDTAGPEM